MTVDADERPVPEEGQPPPASTEEAAPDAHHLGDAYLLFSVLWSVACLYHVFGNLRSADLVTNWDATAASHVVLAFLSLAVLFWPRSVALMAGLSVSVIASNWFEAPFTGNHWVLASFVSLGILAGMAAGFRPRRGLDLDRYASTALGVARWVLLGFYSFAAFAKLNSAFFDTTVSCGNFYFDELLGSFGFELPVTVGKDGWASLVPVGVVMVELSVPVLLVLRRARFVGVVVGLLFHGAIAFDTAHQFHDFSSLLLVLFLAFLPPSFATFALGWARRYRIGAEMVRGVAIFASVVMLGLVWTGDGDYVRIVANGRMIGWVLLLAGTLAAVVAYLWSHRSELLARRCPLDLGTLRWGTLPRWALIVPVLVVFNGLTPYLEIKTAYGWNMYSNLVTVGGETNHLIVPRTWPLTDVQDDVVRIEGSRDIRLAVYAFQDYDIPFLNLRAYLARNPESNVVYERDGERVVVERAGDVPALVEPVSSWEERLFAFRAIDQQDPARCQPGFLPAR